MLEMPAAATTATPPKTAVIDCDVHITPASVQTLFPYLPDNWREYINQSAFRGPADTSYPPNIPTSIRPGAKPEKGPPGADLAHVREQALDAWDVEYAILTCAYSIESIHNPD